MYQQYAIYSRCSVEFRIERYRSCLSTDVCSGLPESKARALDNMGRAYAKMGCYKKAINMYVLVVSVLV